MTLATPDARPEFARTDINLASAGLGAKALSVTDDFFASVDRMLADDEAVFIADKYDDNGKWMDGWESRRRRGPGHDSAVVRLAARGRITGFDVDTAHFTGNYPPACRIEACAVEGDPDGSTVWSELVGMAALGPSAHHYFACDSDTAWTHVRLHIHPDGGVGRFRVYGRPQIDRASVGSGDVDLASALNGARVLAFSDAHYGAYHRLLAPGRGVNMGDGWETRRRREPGSDWIIIALGARGLIEHASIDTAFYKGNFPESFSLQAADLGDFASDLNDAVVTSSMFWDEVVARTRLTADAVHDIASGDVRSPEPVTHVRLNIYPDGGISRLRLYGRLV
ncbi:allantoicase [Stappia sp. ES.058]|uniref:allantoicase n=1 Tax=Stappia sp. ES.058 TaxID=1881061 RepID=UPI00087D05E8|nr:allantoicase [Stappia sp. ES.058]SDU38487.1 allantoicase [Stappia sp. ES.058]